MVGHSDDNTRMLKIQAGEVDAAITVPFSRVAELKKNADLTVISDPSTREDHMLINHEHGALAKKEVREALDLAIDKKRSSRPRPSGWVKSPILCAQGSLYHYADNLQRPYDPEKAKKLLADAGASG